MRKNPSWRMHGIGGFSRLRTEPCARVLGSCQLGAAEKKRITNGCNLDI